MTLPHDFEEMMTQHLGKEEYAQLAEALSLPAPTSIRINPEKTESPETLFSNSAIGQTEKIPVPWCPSAYYLAERPSFTFDPLFHSGSYYVQEASSMFLSHILRQYITTPVIALDLCAAPGGKSTLTLAELPKGSVLIANEVMRQRANILAENIIKWGNPNSIVTNNYAEDFQAFTNKFDLIICDAPCSGEGMFRKDPASIEEWSLENVDTCWRRQRDIVSNIWHTLKEDGLFIYSTCTYNPLEDEENVTWIAKTLGADILSCQPKSEWGLTDTNTHFYPHHTKGEGFFISILRKTSEQKGRHKEKNRKGEKAKTKIPVELKQWLMGSEDFTLFEDKETYSAFPTLHIDLLKQAKRTLKVVHAGVELATIKGKKLQPLHSLALSNHLNREAFPSADVNEQQAIAYLRTEALQLPADTPRGYVLITYKGQPLGFVNNVGNHANNLYPEEWRIRKTI